MAADFKLTPDQIIEIRRILEAEERTGYDDSASPDGLSDWVLQRKHAVSELAQLAQYSRLRPHTRAHLARGFIEKLTGNVLPTPIESAGVENVPVDVLPGVGATASKRLAVLGITTVGELLRHRPRRYIDRSSVVSIADASIDGEVTVVGDVINITVRPARSGRVRVVEAVVEDQTGRMSAVWFNQSYLTRTLKGRRNVAFAGRLEIGPRGRHITSPEYELDLGRMIHAGRLVPVYPLTKGISQRQIRRWIAMAVEDYAELEPDTLSDDLRGRHGLPDVVTAIRNLHFPPSLDAAEVAGRRFAFSELLVYQLAIMRHRHAWRDRDPGRSVQISGRVLAAFGERLPFELTNDQRTALAEILTDLQRDRPMSRLLQGDVGSGKTAVAAGALYAVVGDGWQGAMLAPTEILAEQHVATLRELLNPLGVRVELVTGGTSSGDKRSIWKDVERGAVNVVVGTHAIIQRSARFARLNLAIVDEQHRFGVQQRNEIRSKGYNPHLLAMTATPIPRTLALTVYGDLDVSVLHELPGERKPVKTSFIPVDRRDDAYSFIKRELAAGRQAFIVFPLIDESDALNARAAKDEFSRLSRDVFVGQGESVGLLHGRMSAVEKETSMREFRDGKTKVLVSTAVVEVGIDVPNATVVLIEGAERFGLAQLHQLRGRVGRAHHRSYCLLMSQTTNTSENARLRTLQTVSDGFMLAERDLELRGPGDVIGTRQSGELGFRFAKVTDIETIQKARIDAETLGRTDPDLLLPEHTTLARDVDGLLDRNEWS